MSTVVKMLMSRDDLQVRSLLAELPIMSHQSFYDRLNASKDWQAGELRALADFFEVDVSLFFEDPDTLLGGPGRGPGKAVTLKYPGELAAVHQLRPAA